jgi:hypothetical protein
MSTDHYAHQRNERNRRARTFLHDQLAGGPQPFSLIRQLGAQQGISLSMLVTAKRSLHVESRTHDGYAVWNLPAAA